MSTNGTGPKTTVTLGGRKAIEQVAGAKSADEEKPIGTGEMGFPVGGNPWRVLGFEDPSIMRALRDVSLEDLARMTRRDGHARAMLNVLSWPLRAAKRVIEPDENGEEEADFITRMLNDPPHKGGMTTTMDYVLASHGLAFRDGFKVFEKVAQVRLAQKGEKGQFREVLRKLKPLPSETIAFRYDQFGGFDGVVQTIFWNGQKRIVPMPKEKLLLFTVGKEESPLEGESMFLPAYYHFDKKHRLYYIAHIAAQVGATGLRVGKMGPGTQAKKAAFLKALRDIGVNGAMIANLTDEIEIHTGPNILGDLLKWVEHHDMAMSKSILAHFLDIGSEGKGQLGTATTTSELGDLFVVALEAQLRNIAEGITAYLIPYFVDRNFGTERYPTFRFEPFNDETKAALSEVFKALFNATSQPVPEMMLQVQKTMADVLGLEGVDWDEIETRFTEEQEQKRALEKTVRDAQLEAIKNPPKPEESGPPGKGGPGGGGPPRPAPSPVPQVKLDEDDSFMARAVALAERYTKGLAVNDAHGRPMVPGDRVMVLDRDGDHLDLADEVIYEITEVLGSTCILKRWYEEDPSNDAYRDTTPLARPASDLSLLA